MVDSSDVIEMERAGAMRRIAAAAIDVVALGSIALFISYIGWYFSAMGVPTAIQEARWGLLLNCLVLIYSSSEVFAATSLGKLVVRLRITNADGTAATRYKLISRWSTKWSYFLIGSLAYVTSAVILRWLAGLMGLLVLIGCLAGLGETGMSWHDQWAKTAVFHLRWLSKQRGFEPLLK